LQLRKQADNVRVLQVKHLLAHPGSAKETSCQQAKKQSQKDEL
jgi:hypothetical protein